MSANSSHYDVIVIGGGAAGLMCAMAAGQRGRRALIIDSSNMIGKKILMSGGGRCNFTNHFVEPGNFLSANPQFCISALNRYTQWDFIALVEKHRIPYHQRLHGQLFCDESAKAILAMLVSECEQVGVQIKTHCPAQKIAVEEGQPARFAVTTPQRVLRAESLVVATGGLSIPKLGGSGFGYEIAKQFGHSLLPLRAGLVPFTFSDGFKAVSERLSGLALPVSLSVPEISFSENMLFTHRGLSGPAVLQLSNYWQLGQSIAVDLLPGEDLTPWLKEQKRLHPKSLLRSLLGERLAKSLVLELQALLWPIWADRSMAKILDAELSEVAQQLHSWQLKPAGTEGYRTAEVTLGGVNTNELSSRTMESKRQAGLYFIGEVVDVTGWLGGFNFQWAWSSGHAAGQFV